jgi:predicted nucleic acid-binding protein
MPAAKEKNGPGPGKVQPSTKNLYTDIHRQNHSKVGRRKLSLVECASFVIMWHDKMEKVFGLDKHFTGHGFEGLP